MITYLVLPTVAQVQFKGLNCLTLASGKMYLRVDTTVECSSTSPEYQLLLALTLPFMLLYQSIPLGWAYFLSKHRAELNPPVEDQVAAFERRAKDRR